MTNFEKASQTGVKWVLRIIMGFLFLILLYSIVEYAIILFTVIRNHPIEFTAGPIDESGTFLGIVLPLISGIMLLVIILEMIESVREYVTYDRSSYLLIITEIGLIALIRHFITLDFHHIAAAEMVSIGILTFVLAAFYIALRIVNRKKDTI
jgi:uncharacterized membrane protein (DUF373 family)